MDHNTPQIHQSEQQLRVPHSSWSHRDEWDNRASDPLSFLRRKYLLALAILIATTLPVQAQWDIQESHTTASLRGIHNVGGGVAWASGTEGTVLRTEDGGYLWQGCATPPGAEKLDFRGIQAFDENTAIVMSSGKGDLSRLYKTTDGCRTWKLLFTNPDKEGFWDTLRFYDRSQVSNDLPCHSTCGNFGVLLGDPVGGIFSIWTTSDSGDAWTRWNADDRKHQPTARKGEALFAASNEAAIAPGNNAAFAFVTGGRTARLCWDGVHNHADLSQLWNQLDCRPILPAKSESSGGFALAERPMPQHVEDFMVVGGDYKHPEQSSETAFVSGHDFPFSFIIPAKIVRPTTPPHGYRSAVAYDPTTKTWITVGPNGTDISHDDGRNWSPLKPTAAEPQDADKNWNALSLPFVVGPRGRIGKLRDNAIPTAASSKETQVKSEK
jgi:photosystem II stability/assembly factor-like uncharacterized protein